MKGFDKKYWEENYADPDTMDGIYNAGKHARYLKAIFDLEEIEIESLIDFGFGHGVMLKEMIKTFNPYKASGIEPSPPAFQKAKKKKFVADSKTKFKMHEMDLLQWCSQDHGSLTQFDLGLCNSVLQYIQTRDLKFIIPVMAKRVKYLYLSVPTDIEFQRQLRDFAFVDNYAVSRTQSEYLSIIRKDFVIVSSKLLESRHRIDENDSNFSDYLFRL